MHIRIYLFIIILANFILSSIKIKCLFIIFPSTKRIFIVGSKRHLSSGIEPTLTQETLIMTSVNKTDVVLNTTMSVRTTQTDVRFTELIA